MTNYTSAPVLGIIGTEIGGGISGAGLGAANVFSFGALGDGSHDDSSALLAAIATGRTVYLPKPPVAYLIRQQLTITIPGQIIYGDGKGATVINIDGTFNLAATGVFVVVVTGLPGPQFRDFQINFAQPDTSVRANLVAYPPAFYAQNQARCTWEGIKVNAAMIALDLRQNAGGCSIIMCELCAFVYHIAIDGAQDSIMVQNTRFENDLLTTNQGLIYHDASCMGILSGRCDDLHVAGCLFFCGQGIYTVPSIVSPGDATFGEVSGCDFDSYSGIIQTDGGFLSCAACTFTALVASAQAITQTNGTINLASAWFFGSVATTNGTIVATAGAGQRALIALSACRFNVTGNAFTVQLNSAGGGDTEINISGCRFDPDPNLLTTENCISINTGCLITMTGCRFGAKSSSTANALSIIADGAHNVTGNSFNGWPVALPGGHSVLIYANNN